MLATVEQLLKIHIFAELESEILVQLQPHTLVRNYYAMK